MRSLVPIALALAITTVSGPTADNPPVNRSYTTVLLEPSREFVSKSIAATADLQEDRRALLDSAAEQIRARLEESGEAHLTFICTHNSRRSHLSHVWAQVAAAYYEIEGVSCYSGGTETTACNIRTVNALRRTGLSVVRTTQGDNPRYLVQFSDDHPPIPAFSKVYNEGDNPAEGYLAFMCCSDADVNCPVVTGSVGRIALHYVDPKVADNTPEESSTYDTRCAQIAAEMFYLMSRVSR